MSSDQRLAKRQRFRLTPQARVAICAWLLLMAACTPAAPARVRIATTTSVHNSGLLGYLEPAFKQASGFELLIQATGSGRALLLLERRDVDVVISHAPKTEQRLLAKHSEWSYRKFAYNRFIVVGPSSDPAGLRSARDVTDAFRRIVDSGAAFVSRGDESGTHERENSFWDLVDKRPSRERLIISGRGMAQALRHADQANAYTLTDEPTYWQLEGELELVPLFTGDERLLNTYAVIADRSTRVAAVFQDWLVSEAGRQIVGRFTIDRKRAYEIWPRGCADDTPPSTPCRSR